MPMPVMNLVKPQDAEAFSAKTKASSGAGSLMTSNTIQSKFPLSPTESYLMF